MGGPRALPRRAFARALSRRRSLSPLLFVDVYEGALFGEFTLQPDQTLRGYIKPANNMPAIPAKIGLF